jgi:hypothetical protein
MYADNSYEELSRQSLVTKAVTINDTGRAYFRATVLAERAATKLKNFYETHGSVGRVTLMKVVEYVTFIVGLCCIYVVDVLLFGASAAYVGHRFSGAKATSGRRSRSSSCRRVF